jgi:hypothetical protein
LDLSTEFSKLFSAQSPSNLQNRDKPVIEYILCRSCHCRHTSVTKKAVTRSDTAYNVPKGAPMIDSLNSSDGCFVLGGIRYILKCEGNKQQFSSRDGSGG